MDSQAYLLIDLFKSLHARLMATQTRPDSQVSIDLLSVPFRYQPLGSSIDSWYDRVYADCLL